VYIENLLHLLNLLEISGQSGVLSCSPSANIEYASWQASLLLSEGKVREVKVYQTAGGNLVFEERTAFEWLKLQKGLYWQLKEAHSGASPTHLASPIGQEATRMLPGSHPYRLERSPATNPDMVPRRTLEGMRLGIQGVPSHAWTREHRTIFMLIDGIHSRAGLLRLLPASFEKHIDTILSDLRLAGLIE
jgi:hypothetical protein